MATCSAGIAAKDVEGLAWEAVLAAGQKEPLFAGVTGLTWVPGPSTPGSSTLYADA